MRAPAGRPKKPPETCGSPGGSPGTISPLGGRPKGDSFFGDSLCEPRFFFRCTKTCFWVFPDKGAARGRLASLTIRCLKLVSLQGMTNRVYASPNKGATRGRFVLDDSCLETRFLLGDDDPLRASPNKRAARGHPRSCRASPRGFFSRSGLAVKSCVILLQNSYYDAHIFDRILADSRVRQAAQAGVGAGAGPGPGPGLGRAG